MNEADVLRIVVALIFIVMAIMAGAWAVRRSGLGRSGNPQALRVVASQSLGNRAWVAVVEVEDARLVVGVTAQQINLLHTLPARPDSDETGPHGRPADTPDTARFTATLVRALKRR